MRCRFEEESVRPKKEAGEPKEKQEEIEAKTGFDVNVHFATLSRMPIRREVGQTKERSRQTQREARGNRSRDMF